MCGATALRKVAVVCLAAALSVACNDSPASHGPGPAAADGGSDAGEPATPAQDAGSEPKPGSDAGLTLCGSVSCRAPAICSDGKQCRCPEGYDDANGDGSQCDDRNECDEARGGCDKHATCTNTRGGFSCECNGPAYVGDGKYCNCGGGYTRDREGLCLASDGLACEDNLDCVNGHCEGGTCCAHACSEPSDCHTAQAATCRDGKTCEYPALPDGSECDDLLACTAASSCQNGQCTSGKERTSCDDDNPCTDDSCAEPIGCMNMNNTASCDDRDACTQTDSCQAGACHGDVKDCSAAADACNLGACDPANGACVKTPKASGEICDDANSCTLAAQCQAGVCVGAGNACGINALTCTAGTPNVCGCAAGFLDNHVGTCVPMNDECANASVCSADANCFDPSNAPGDVTCSCKPGYASAGQLCVAIDPCANNPCGAGSCVPGNAGSHTCTCEAGYIPAADTCVCDMTGTFATRTQLDAKWATLDQIEGGTDTTYSYAIERHSYDAQGNLMLELTLCGETSLDICGLGIAPILAAEAYAQFLPVHIWGTPSMPVIRTKLTLPKPVPGSAFVTDNVAALTGISLANPLGAWPPSRRDISGTVAFDGSAVNGATWLDQDNDAKIGLTSYAVPPGGIKADGVPPDPVKDFGPLSPSCPRQGGTHTPYAYWPAPVGFSLALPARIQRFYAATRVISAFNGTINSCDDISGSITGPDNGKPQLDGRTGGCLRATSSGEADCSATAIDFVDTAPPNNGQEIVNASFRTKRVATPVTCAMVRELSYD
jgi:hypothetical protein